MKIIRIMPVVVLASVFVVLLPNSAMAISDYQSGYDDGYAAAQDSHGDYAIGDACEHQSTQYCNGFLAGYTTEFFALYQNIPTKVVVHETGSTVVVIHPHQYYNPHASFVVVHRQYPQSHVFIVQSHNPPAYVQPYPFFQGHVGNGPYQNYGHGPNTNHGVPGPQGHHNH